jgi:hypothetical protein
MKKTTSLFAFLLLSLLVFGQKNLEKKTQPIVDEGIVLYKSEMASWYGTDLFLERFKDRNKIGGYFSYLDNGVPTCIFYGTGDVPAVIGSIGFDESFNTKTATINMQERSFTETESGLYTIRKAAQEVIYTDSLFKVYENSNLNLIPIIHKGQRKVYVLTGPTEAGVVIFGNDYLLSFNKKNQLRSKKALHRNIISVEYTDESGAKSVGAMHTHARETGDFITATDICTLMLYSKFANWKQHMVISEKYVSIWNCETNKLTTIPKAIFEKNTKNE